MHYIWTGSWPANRVPRVSSLTLDSRAAGANVTLAPKTTVQAGIDATDPDGDTLAFEWVIMRESAAMSTGGDAEAVPESFPDLIGKVAGSTVELSTPAEPGAYRLFVYVRDSNGNAGHANLPFLVHP